MKDSEFNACYSITEDGDVSINHEAIERLSYGQREALVAHLKQEGERLKHHAEALQSERRPRLVVDNSQVDALKKLYGK